MKNLFSPSLLLGVITAVGASSCTSKGAKETVVDPNILIILLDDAGYNDFGFMGSKDLPTPNIDNLASSGVVFTDAHVSATVSGPSRAGLLTGRYQQKNGYESNLRDTLGLGLKEETIGDIFKQNGYATACFGKWHQGNDPDYHPNKRGFEHFYGFIAGSRSYFYNPDIDDLPGSHRSMQLNGKQVSFEGYMTDVLGSAASTYIEEQVEKKTPFMVYLAYNAVHTPMEATQEDLDRFEGHERQQLAALTWALDRSVGEVIKTLKQTGVYDNTLIFFVNDNGGAFNNQSSNFPLKGFKGNKYEGGHRVPFVMAYGDRISGEYDGLTSALDIVATAVDLANIDRESLKYPLDGVNLLPYVKGEIEGQPHSQLFWRKQDMAAARMGDYKLIRVKGVGQRLYNLKDNLFEDKDLQHELPEVTKEMNEALSNWEEGLINPPLWEEGAWGDVTREIHRDLMNNREVSAYTPEELEAKQKQENK